MSTRSVFVVRDAVLVAPAAVSGNAPDDGSVAALTLRDGVVPALARFRAAGFDLVLLADPPLREAAAVDGFLERLLASQDAGLAGVRRCVHAAGNGCDCALPGIGLVADDIADPGLDRQHSLVVGTDDRARRLARAMGLASFVIAPGSGWSEVAHTVLDRPRRARIERRTRETAILVEVDLDRAGEPEIATGIGFFDHMLEQLGKHGGFELRVRCEGDLEVDEHHTIEDVALAIGQALRTALGDKRGIGRYGFLLPMDEAEARVAIDLSGRAYPVFEGEFPRENVGGLPTELVGHFFRSLSETLGAAIHVSVRGDNAHHMIEACFKGVARALRQAFARSGQDLPSTKGTL